MFRILGEFISETDKSVVSCNYLWGLCFAQSCFRHLFVARSVESLQGVDTEAILQVREQRLQYLLKNVRLPFPNHKGRGAKRSLNAVINGNNCKRCWGSFWRFYD